jgi:hypothetical protein
VTCAIFARFAASLSRLTFCAGVSFFGAGSAVGRVVARPGFVCAHTPVAVNRVESLVYFDMLGRRNWEELEALQGGWMEGNKCGLVR